MDLSEASKQLALMSAKKRRPIDDLKRAPRSHAEAAQTMISAIDLDSSVGSSSPRDFGREQTLMSAIESERLAVGYGDETSMITAFESQRNSNTMVSAIGSRNRDDTLTSAQGYESPSAMESNMQTAFDVLARGGPE